MISLFFYGATVYFCLKTQNNVQGDELCRAIQGELEVEGIQCALTPEDELVMLLGTEPSCSSVKIK